MRKSFVRLVRRVLAVMLLSWAICFGRAQDNLYFENIFFTFPPAPLAYPGALLQATNGNIYGITRERHGSIYEFTPAGNTKRLVAFEGQNGSDPFALIEGSDSNLYGTTEWGGPFGYGTIFKLAPSGELTTLHSFDGTNGSNPGSLLQAKDGNFYSATGYGVILMVTPSGMVTPLGTLDGISAWEGQSGPSALIEASNGDLYGVADGGLFDAGVIFRLSKSGDISTLVSFNGTNGASPRVLLQGEDLNFYGVTALGGAFDQGTIFRATSTGALTTLKSFSGASSGLDVMNGGYPLSLVQGTDGTLYGTTSVGGSNNCGTVFRLTTTGNLATLASFDGTNGIGGSTLVRGLNGSLYGTSPAGGSRGGGYGTLFELIGSQQLKSLFAFGSEETIAVESFVQDTNADFYGIGDGGVWGNGTFFKLASSGTLTTLLSFDPQTTPFYRYLVAGSDGNFYAPASLEYGRPVIIRITRSGTLSTLASFDDGVNPYALIQGNDGNLYGTTAGGGIRLGSVFKLELSGTLTTLASFNSINGSDPTVLIQGSDGALYGVALGGVGSTIFKVTPGAFVPVFAIVPDIVTDLVQGGDGNLYGVSWGGFFKVLASGAVTQLASFDGAFAGSSILMGGDGNFYGTTFRTFDYSCTQSTVFRATPSGTLDTLALHDDCGFHHLDPWYARPPWLSRGRDDGELYGTTGAGAAIVRLRPPPELTSIAQKDGTVELTWSAFPNRSYEVQFTTNIANSAWESVSGVVLATNSVMSLHHASPGPRGFYRVRLVQ